MKLATALKTLRRIAQQHKPIEIAVLRITTRKMKKNGKLKKRKKDRLFAKEHPHSLIVFLNGKTGELPPEVKEKDLDIKSLILNQTTEA